MPLGLAKGNGGNPIHSGSKCDTGCNFWCGASSTHSQLGVRLFCLFLLLPDQRCKQGLMVRVILLDVLGPTYMTTIERLLLLPEEEQSPCICTCEQL